MSFDANPYSSPTEQYAPDTELAYGGEPADRVTRLIAAIIDAVILIVICIAINFVLEFLVRMLFGAGFFAGIISYILGAVVGIGVFILVNGKSLAETGQTIGKKLMNIRIVTDAGLKPDFQDLIVKRYGVTWLIGLIPVIGGIYGLVNVLMIFRESKKCLHDDIAGTRVVKL